MHLTATTQNITPLIPLTSTDDGLQAVMGRALHTFLEVSTEYRHWFPRMVEYGFIADQDFAVKNDRVQDSLGRERDAHNHIISLDMAKEISMIQRTEKGKQARQYFLECERQAKEPRDLSRKQILTMALEAEERAELEAARARALEAPAKSWNALAGANGDVSVSEAAKILSRDPHITIGRDQLFAFMKSIGWVFRTKGHRAHWEANQQKAINTGRLAHKPGKTFLNEKTGEYENASPTVRVTLKGIGELHQILGGADQLEIEGVAA